MTAAEYNHGQTEVLKNALDSAVNEWNPKPIAFVGYGATSGLRARRKSVAIPQRRTTIERFNLGVRARTGVFVAANRARVVGCWIGLNTRHCRIAEKLRDKCAHQRGAKSPPQLISVCPKLIDAAHGRIVFIRPPSVIVKRSRCVRLNESRGLAVQFGKVTPVRHGLGNRRRIQFRRLRHRVGHPPSAGHVRAREPVGKHQRIRGHVRAREPVGKHQRVRGRERAELPGGFRFAVHNCVDNLVFAGVMSTGSKCASRSIIYGESLPAPQRFAFDHSWRELTGATIVVKISRVVCIEINRCTHSATRSPRP